jgi:hypothetical protein
MVHWIAEYDDGTSIERDETKSENNFYAIDRRKIKFFKVIIKHNGKEDIYSLNCKTGEIFINEKKIPLGDAEEYTNKSLNYGEGLIWFIKAYTEFNPFSHTSSGNIDESYNFGWKVNYNSKKIQVICSIDTKSNLPLIQISITDLTTHKKENDLITNITVI